MMKKIISNLKMLTLNKENVLLILKGTVIVIVTSSILAYLRTFLPFNTDNTKNINEGIQANFVSLLMPLLISPILEELIFRKWLPNLFNNIFRKWLAIIIANLLFAIVHMDIFLITYFFNGLIYSWYYEKSKNLCVPITIHILYNFFVFLITN